MCIVSSSALSDCDPDDNLDDLTRDDNLGYVTGNDVTGNDVTDDVVSTEEMSALSALRAQMKSRLEDCDVIIRECDEVLKEAKQLDEKSNKRAIKK